MIDRYVLLFDEDMAFNIHTPHTMIGLEDLRGKRIVSLRKERVYVERIASQSLLPILEVEPDE